MHRRCPRTLLGCLAVICLSLSACPTASDPDEDGNTDRDTGTGESERGGEGDGGSGDAGAGNEDADAGELDSVMDAGMADVHSLADSGMLDAGLGSVAQKDSGSMADPGMEGDGSTGLVPDGVTTQVASFDSCDLATVDWEDVYNTSETFCDGDGGCTYYDTYVEETLYTDLDGDGVDEAWVSLSTNVSYDVGAAGTTVDLYVHLRDATCNVSWFSLPAGTGFDYFDIEVVARGVRVTGADDASVIYRLIDGKLAAEPDA